MDVERTKQTIRAWDRVEANRLADPDMVKNSKPATKLELIEQIYSEFYSELEVKGFHQGEVSDDIARPLFLKMLKQAVSEIRQEILDSEDGNISTIQVVAGSELNKEFRGH